jgi:hypothetical protein
MPLWAKYERMLCKRYYVLFIIAKLDKVLNAKLHLWATQMGNDAQLSENTI